ncbi:MAG: hypothetical protein U0572_10030 [Phycisphaerales bacterium]
MRTVIAGVAAAAMTFTASHALAGGCEFATYPMTPAPMTWQDAEAYAVSVGGHLVAIERTEEQSVVSKPMTFRFLPGTFVFLAVPAPHFH